MYFFGSWRYSAKCVLHTLLFTAFNSLITAYLKESGYLLCLKKLKKSTTFITHYDISLTSPVNHCRSQSWTRPSSSRTSVCALIMKLDWRRCSCRTAQQAWTHPTPTPWPSGVTVGFVSLAPLNASLRSDMLEKTAST